MHTPHTTLNETAFAQGVRFLADRDEHLAAVVKTYGQPPLWMRDPGFPTLVYIILEQQVSLASARAAFGRLKAAANPLTPGRFLKLTDVELLRIGFSRQKTLYTRLLAESLARRYFNLGDLHELHDDPARKMLIAFKGIGPWTADIYLLSALGRPDIWPTRRSRPSHRRAGSEAPSPASFAGETRSAQRTMETLACSRRPPFLARLPFQARPEVLRRFLVVRTPHRVPVRRSIREALLETQTRTSVLVFQEI